MTAQAKPLDICLKLSYWHFQTTWGLALQITTLLLKYKHHLHCC